MRALIYVYITEEVAHAHAKNAPLEWFSSTPRLGVVLIVWLRIFDRHSWSIVPLDSNLPDFLEDLTTYYMGRPKISMQGVHTILGGGVVLKEG